MDCSKYILNWKPAVKDPRRKLFVPRTLSATDDQFPPLPNRVDLRGGFQPVYDQGNIGSCTANALAALFSFQAYDQQLNVFTPSRLFIYWNERNMEGTITTDAGAFLSDGIKVLNTLGTCSEDSWPYIEMRYQDRPSDEAFEAAKKNTALEFQSIPSNDTYAMCACLADGYPFVCGIPLFRSFQTEYVAHTGDVSMPTDFDEYIGGHAICVVGYDGEEEKFLCRNSWSERWGMKGYFTVPFEYLKSSASDIWTIRKVAQAA